MNQSILKLNNYIEYHGRLNKHHGRVGVIKSIETDNGEDAFIVIFKKRFPTDDETEIRAYIDEVRPILLTPDFFEKNNFSFDEKDRFFEKENMVICRPIYVRNSGNSVSYDDKGFRVITGSIKDFSNEKEVMDNTTSVHSLNDLQNYYEDLYKAPFKFEL